MKAGALLDVSRSDGAESTVTKWTQVASPGMENPSWRRTLWICALVIAFLLSLRGTFRGGYVSGDYPTHLFRMLDSNRLFDFSLADPPLYVLLGHGLYKLIGRNNGFLITLTMLQATINLVALWFFFAYTERRFKSPVVHLAMVLMLTFLPVRLMHSVSLGADWMTIPMFVLLLFLFDRFLVARRSETLNALWLGLGLAVAVWSKFSFVAMLPAFFLIFVFLWWKQSWSLSRFVCVCALSLVLPTALMAYSHWETGRVDRPMAKTMWLPWGPHPGQPDMDYKDLFSVKLADLQLFKAPEMWKREPGEGPGLHFGYKVAHLHSYLALSHMFTFTDTWNLFQDLPGDPIIDRYLIPDFKTRQPWKTPVLMGSMWLGTLWTLLALAGTPWILFGAAKHLFQNKLEREDVTALLGFAYFLLMFLPIPFVFFGCFNGYWTSRLILPPLLFFFMSAFLLLDRKIVAKLPRLAYVVLVLAMAQSGIVIVALT